MNELIQLRNTLAERYPESADARRILAEAGIDAAPIHIEGLSSINMWQEIIGACERRMILPALLAQIQKEEP